jgi:hypothetical protein
MRDRSGVTHVAVNATAEGCVAMLLRRYQDVSFPWWALGIKPAAMPRIESAL